MFATQALLRHLGDLWCHATRTQRIATYIGVFLIATGFAFFGAFLLSDGVWAGMTGYRKPTIFGLSGGLTVITVAWLMHYFPARPRLNAIILWGMAATMVLEVVVISLQWFRGEPSHFNLSSPLNATLWSLMGLSIGIFALLATVLTGLSFRRLTGSPVMNFSIRVGMVLFLFSQISGQLIVVSGVSATLTGDGHFLPEMMPVATVIGAAGNVKLPHAITLHAIQILPLLGLLLTFSGWDTRFSRAQVALAGLGLTGLTCLSLHQALAGRAPMDLSQTSAGIGAASLLLLAMPFFTIFVRLLVAISSHFSELALCPRATTTETFTPRLSPPDKPFSNQRVWKN